MHADKAIDLINVCFDPYEAPDRYTGVESLLELRKVFPSRHWNWIAVDVSASIEPQGSLNRALIEPQ